MLKRRQKTNLSEDNLKIKKVKTKSAGITLISLVVTIIILLILAGVSLNATVGNSGVITQAQSAAQASKIAEISDKIEEVKVEVAMDDEDDLIWLDQSDLKTAYGLDSDLAKWLELQNGEVVYKTEITENGVTTTIPDDAKTIFEGADIKPATNYDSKFNGKNFTGLNIDVGAAKDAITIGPNVVVCLDMSGSMKGTRLSNAKLAIKNMIDGLFEDESITSSRTLFSVITFSTSSSTLSSITETTRGYITDLVGFTHNGTVKSFAKTIEESNLLKEQIDKLTISGSPATYYTKPLSLAKTTLESFKNSTDSSLSSFKNNKEFVVFLSDGDPWDSDYLSVTDELKKNDVTVYTIGYGINQDGSAHKKLKNMASEDEEGNILCYLASDGDASEIMKAFENINENIKASVLSSNVISNGILTIVIDKGKDEDGNEINLNRYKIDPNEPIVVTTAEESNTYYLYNLPTEIKYNSDEGTIIWNIRKYSDYTVEQFNKLNISFKVIPKEDN